MNVKQTSSVYHPVTLVVCDAETNKIVVRKNDAYSRCVWGESSQIEPGKAYSVFVSDCGSGADPFSLRV